MNREFPLEVKVQKVLLGLILELPETLLHRLLSPRIAYRRSARFLKRHPAAPRSINCLGDLLTGISAYKLGGTCLNPSLARNHPTGSWDVGAHGHEPLPSSLPVIEGLGTYRRG